MMIIFCVSLVDYRLTFTLYPRPFTSFVGGSDQVVYLLFTDTSQCFGRVYNCNPGQIYFMTPNSGYNVLLLNIFFSW